LAIALPLRSADDRLRSASWIIVVVLLGSGWMLTRGAVERRAQAGADVLALKRALAEVADTTPARSYAFVVVPDRIGAIPFARNAQGGLMLPPVQARPLSGQLVVQLEQELPKWPALIANNVVGRFKAESLADVTANPQASGATYPFSVADRFYCWNVQGKKLVAMPLVFAPGFGDWNEVWARGLAAAGCRS
jgi:hypothetical protein